MRILVTGGAGFIGSHVVQACLEEGHEVVVVDNLARGKKEDLPDEAQFYRLDIAARTSEEVEALHQTFESCQPEVVIHLAAQVDVQTSLKQPAFDATVNIVGLLQVLEACRATGVAKIVYASSAAIYGELMSLPVTESHRIAPSSPYGLSKYIGELYLKLYKEQYGLDFTVLRYANVYGSGQDGTGEGGVVAIFVDRLCHGEAPAIYGDGNQTRDFVYVKDVARANVLALNRGSGEILNISTGKQVSVNKLFSLLARLMEWSGGATYLPPRFGDVYASCLDNSEARRVLGWKPQYKLEDGLADMLKALGNPSRVIV